MRTTTSARFVDVVLVVVVVLVVERLAGCCKLARVPAVHDSCSLTDYLFWPFQSAGPNCLLSCLSAYRLFGAPVTARRTSTCFSPLLTRLLGLAGWLVRWMADWLAARSPALAECPQPSVFPRRSTTAAVAAAAAAAATAKTKTRGRQPAPSTTEKPTIIYTHTAHALSAGKREPERNRHGVVVAAAATAFRACAGTRMRGA